MGGVDTGMDLDDLLDVPGDRIPLLTAGEGHVVLRLLSPLRRALVRARRWRRS
jgi:hypothetical protein